MVMVMVSWTSMKSPSCSRSLVSRSCNPFHLIFSGETKTAKEVRELISFVDMDDDG
jgi:hypothetical protein